MTDVKEHFFYLLDIERTTQSGFATYWKGSKFGYTHLIERAGIFKKDQAEEIVKNDRDNMTIMISLKQLEKVFKRDIL